MYEYFIVILFNFLTLQQTMDNLMVKENLISKQLILTGEAKCEVLQADRVVTEELDISTEFSSDVLQLNSLSPFRSGNRGDSLLETEDSEIIHFSGNPEFQNNIYIDDDDNKTTSDEKTIITSFVEINGQSQWIPVVMNTFSSAKSEYWHVQKKSDEIDNLKLRENLKQNNYFNYRHEHFKKSWLNQFEFVLVDEQIQKSKSNEELIFQYNSLPDQHTYVNVQFNFLILTDLWRDNNKMWMKIDGELVWIQNHHYHFHQSMCLYMDHFLKQLQDGNTEQLQIEIQEMQSQYWQIPVNAIVKHIRHKIHIEIGIKLGLPPDCVIGSKLLFQELENRFYLFAIDDFTLHYK